MQTRRIVHFLSGLEVGGKERVALQLAGRARSAGLEPELLLFDTPYRGEPLDLDPGELPVHFLQRRPGVDGRLVLALVRRWRERRVDVVHAHNDTGIFYACAAARLVRRGPAVCATFHTKPGHDTRGARALTRWAARRADGITAVSDELAEVLVRDGWVARCDTLWNGVDLEEFTPAGPGAGWRDRLSLPEGAVLAAHVGRFDPIKRHVDLVEAARRLSGSEPPIAFVLVGEGPTRDEVRRNAADVPAVHFVPRVVDMAAFLRETDLVVLCSDHEAAPRVLLEALACARPVVATDVGGVTRMLTDEGGRRPGELVPPRRPAELAAAIRSLAANPERRRALGELARTRAAAFSAEREWSRYAALYEEALSRRRPRP